MNHYTHAILAPPGQVSAQLPVARRLQLVGQNAGNLIFQYAVTQIIDGAPLHICEANGNYHLPEAKAGPGPLIFPAANHLRNADWSDLCNFLEVQDREIVVLGLGADRDESFTLKENPSLNRFIALLRERAQLVTTRGLRSSRIAAELGLDGTLPLGCPSIFLNPAPDLGQLLAAQLSRPCPRIAIHAADPFNLPDGIALGIEATLTQWAIDGEGKLWVLPSGGEKACSFAEGKTDALSPLAFHSFAITHADGEETALKHMLSAKGYFPSSARAWIARMTSCDISFGTRAHGALATVAAGIPGVLVPPDERCKELVATMHLPHVAREDFLLAARHSSERARQAVTFSATRFDQWRGSAAKSLSLALKKSGLQPSRLLQAIAHARS